MKLVPGTLKESLEFERGKDPLKTLNVGIHPLVRNIDSDDLFLLFNVTDHQSGGVIPFESFIRFPMYEDMDPEWQKEIYERGFGYHKLLSDHIEWGPQIDNYPDMEKAEEKATSEGKYVYDYTPEGDYISIAISDIELPSASPALETASYLEMEYPNPPKPVDENVQFERGSDPKKSLDIGEEYLMKKALDMLREEPWILYDIDEGINPETGKFDKKYYMDNFNDEKDPEELNQLELISRALDGKTAMGEYFDWKEEEEMEKYLDKNSAKWNYIYNMDPGGDGWQVFFSNIPLPLEDLDY